MNDRDLTEDEIIERHWLNIWTLDAEGHCGSCGILWHREAVTPAPAENGMNYCPRCGAKLEQAKDGGA